MAHEGREHEALSDRAQTLLRILIESYIRDGQPVGSRVLSRDSGLQLSSATIRNVMADLEEYGFVSSPHTSAGRIPTDKGYRFFVDTLLRMQPLDESAVAEIRRQVDSKRDSSKDLISSVSQLLSSVTKLAGVVTVPRTQQASITHIEFVILSGIACWRFSSSMIGKFRTASSSSSATTRPMSCGAPRTSSMSSSAAA